MFYVDVNLGDEYTFYYNMNAEINKAVIEKVGTVILNKRPLSQEAIINLAKGKALPKEGPIETGMIGSFNEKTGETDYKSVLDMVGITALVKRNLALDVLSRAMYYCPVDTGRLVSSGRIEDIDSETSRIFFDCPYAWFVHEHTWKKHAYPTCAKFLTLAIQEVQAGLGGL